MPHLTQRNRYRKRCIRSSPVKYLCDTYIVILSKNIPTAIERVRYYRNTRYPYAVCPNCKNIIERDYQNYCETCGQNLDWSLWEQGVIIAEYVDGPNSRRCIRKIILKRKQKPFTEEDLL